MIYRSSSLEETQKLAAKTARSINKMPVGKRARIVALHGELGTGKTSFVQGFLRTSGVRGRITSPTFTLVKRYAVSFPRKRESTHSNREKFYAFHLDWYRLHSKKQLQHIGWDEIIQ